MNVFIKTASVFLLLLAFFVAAPVFAANIFLDAKNQSFAQGEEFLATVFLNTEEESINAVEGKLLFPSDLLEAREIRDGNSSINFWIEKPHSSQLGAIAFSGITPGGLSGPRELLFSVIFRAKKEGGGAIQTDGLKVLRNDGLGTPAEMKISNFQFLISNQIPISQIPKPAIKDNEPPEKFKPEISQAEDLFYGKYFLVFATQDKGSGIGRYEVREGFWSKFAVVESPYLLQNQKLDKKIFVKAVDKVGNERTEILYPPDFRPWYKNYWIFGILIIMAIIWLWLKFIKSR